jgi:PAS domain-containing protein
LQNILLVQIDSVHAIAVRDALIHSNDGDFRVIWLTTCCDALNHLADMRRPAPAAPQIPILILTAARDEDVSTDVSGKVTYLNVVAEALTGWSHQEAVGHPFDDVFRIIDSITRDAARNPMTSAIQLNTTGPIDCASLNNCAPCWKSRLSIASRTRPKRSAPRTLLNGNDSTLNWFSAERS